MNIYQGEPLAFKIHKKLIDVTTSEEHYVSSFEGYVFEALLKDSLKNVIRTWSTSDGTIEIGQETIDDETAAYASWGMLGEETVDLKEGLYSIELARVVDAGREIGVASDVVLVKEALIKEGV